ncbi:MAG: MFS transporter [Oscillospiraceae bacterium]|nr:MFS transporter [Oscillospiraceae bacterium]
MKKQNTELRDFYLLWGTQSLSQLGSAMTGFALTLWLYERTGSALSAAMLTICTYAPYVLMSIFAGAVSDRFDKKKAMLVCDVFAAMCTVLIFALYKAELLTLWHLYAVNAISGLMNTVQQPASEVAYTLVIPKEHYQRTSGLQSLSRSLISIGNPLIAAAVYGAAGLGAVIVFDLSSFVLAFVILACFIRIPMVQVKNEEGGKIIVLAKEGLQFLKSNSLVLHVILFMAGVNLIASAFDAVLPALVIPRFGSRMLGVVTSCSGIAMVLGSLLVTVMPKPKDRVKVICLTMLFSLGTENYLLAFSRNPFVWCIGQVLGWVLVPVMSANQNVIMRNAVPVELQGRVYACRNTLQFFTIPVGLAMGGFLVDEIFEPFMAGQGGNSLYTLAFGSGKGSGAAFVLFILGLSGSVLCLVSGSKLRRYRYVEP